MSSGDSLARRLNVAELVAVYAAAERDIRTSFAAIDQAEKAIGAAFGLAEARSFYIQSHCHHTVAWDDVDHTLEKLRRQLWQTLIERLELRRMMSIEAWEKLDKELREGKFVPEITLESVEAMARQFRDALPEMLEAAVVEVFDWLRPPRSRYKTNSELEIGPRVVLGFTVERNWRWRIRYGSEQKLTALENVFSALDGRGQITKGYYSKISEAVGALPEQASDCVGETEYFAFRGFRNGNLHLRFRRLDLLARLNQIAGGRRLRPHAKAS